MYIIPANCEYFILIRYSILYRYVPAITFNYSFRSSAIIKWNDCLLYYICKFFSYFLLSSLRNFFLNLFRQLLSYLSSIKPDTILLPLKSIYLRRVSSKSLPPLFSPLFSPFFFFLSSLSSSSIPSTYIYVCTRERNRSKEVGPSDIVKFYEP